MCIKKNVLAYSVSRTHTQTYTQVYVYIYTVNSR